jgi:putative copper resistance protein D
VVLAVSGVVGLAARTSLEALLESSDYLVLLVAKLTLLLALGVAGAVQRRSHLTRRPGGTGGFLLLAVGELVLMAAAMGLAVTLSHTAS